MEGNIILVLTNLPFINTAWRAYQRGQFISAIAISVAGVASMVYHGSETHKHNHITSGLGYAKSRRAQSILLNIDRFGAVLAGLTVAYQSGKLYQWIPHGAALLACMVISEVFAPRWKYHWIAHITFHSIWHVGVFVVADWVLGA